MSLSSVLTMGFQPAGNVFLVTTMGYGQGADIPQPPSAVVQSFFGGGPFIRRYGYDPKHYSQDEDDLYTEARELRDELPGIEAEKVETAIAKAVEAVIEEKPKAFIDAQRVYDRVFASVRKSLRDELFRAEVERRIHEEEEDQLDLMLIEALS